jgi:hypothetical protein
MWIFESVLIPCKFSVLSLKYQLQRGVCYTSWSVIKVQLLVIKSFKLLINWPWGED